MKKFIKEPFSFPEDFWYRKKYMEKRGISRFSIEICCLTVPRNFVGEPFCVCSGQERGQKSQFPVEIFLSHSAEIFRRGTLYCFTNFGYRKFFCFGGLCQKFRFSLEFFSSHSTVPKIFLGESFSASFNSAIKKFWK